MFIGHFGVGLAAKRLAPELNLGILFIACQWLDLVWPVLVLLGIETVSVDPEATIVTPLNFSHYPYSHSLVAALLYSFLGAVIAWRVFKSVKTGVVLGAVVFSHWLLDFLTHRPDMPLFFDNTKFGLGLWNSLWGTLIVEGTLFILGIVFYLKSSPLLHRKRKIIFWTMNAFLSLVYLGNVFGPKPPIDTPSAMIAGPALSMWLIVIWGYYADRKA
jgi:hypothetical protein